MQLDRHSHVPPGWLIGSILLAVLMGGLLPLLTIVEAMLLMPVMMFGGILLVFLQCHAGWVPAGIFTVAQMFSCAYLGGASFVLAAILTNLIPGIVVIRGIQTKQSFWGQLQTAIVIFITGLLIAITAAYAIYGRGMISRLVNLLRAQYDRMSDEDFLPLVNMYNSAMSSSGITAAKMTAEAFRGQINGVLDLMQEAYVQSIAGQLMAGAVFSAVLSVLWGNWKLASRGFATAQSFIGPSHWFLPAKITNASLFFMVLGWLISRSSIASGSAVYNTISSIVSAIFIIQAFAAMDRKMINSGMRTSGRRTVITVVACMALIMPTIRSALIAVGVLSAMFGSHGSVRMRMNNIHRNDDDIQ